MCVGHALTGGVFMGKGYYNSSGYSVLTQYQYRLFRNSIGISLKYLFWYYRKRVCSPFAVLDSFGGVMLSLLAN